MAFHPDVGSVQVSTQDFAPVTAHKTPPELSRQVKLFVFNLGS